MGRKKVEEDRRDTWIRTSLFERGCQASSTKEKGGFVEASLRKKVRKKKKGGEGVTR